MRFRRNDRLKIRAAADLTPLIDVVFQLVLFFMLSATFVVQTSVNIELPQAEGTQVIEQKDITITLQFDETNPDGSGLIFVGGLEQPIAMSNLRSYVETQLQGNDQPFVLIRPDWRIRTGQLVEVLGLLNALGVYNYGIAAVMPDEEQ